MPFVAPWLRGPDVLGAIQAGANTALHLRAQDLSEQEAADRRALQYADMLRQKSQFEQQLKERASESAARLALAASNAATQAGWHKEATAARQAADALRDRHNLEMERLFGERTTAMQKDAIEPEEREIAPGVFARRLSRSQWQYRDKKGDELDPRTINTLLKDANLDPTAEAALKSSLNTQILRRTAPKELPLEFAPAVTPPTSAAESLLTPTLNAIGGLSSPSLPTDAAPRPSSKRFRWQDGDIVPIEEQEE